MNDPIMKIKGKREHRVIRTVYAGTVQIGGVTYRPKDTYNGELDGGRYLFARYDMAGYYNPYVALICSERHSKDLITYEQEMETAPYIVDGYFWFQTWYPSLEFMQSLVDNERYDEGYRHLIRVHLELDKVGV